MRRFLAITLSVSSVAVGLAACDTYDGGPRGGRGYADPCEQYTSCGECTPVLGCGWCATSGGSACLSDPDECAGAAQFSWTWEPTGCAVGPDAGIVAVDGGGPPAIDASTPPLGDAAPPPTDATPDVNPPPPTDASSDAAGD